MRARESPPKSGKCSARGVRVCERASVCVGGVCLLWWFGSVEIVFFRFRFSAVVAVVCFAYVAT